MISPLVTPKKTIPLLWIATLLLSVGLHVGLVHLNPNLFFGSGELVSSTPRSDRKRVRVQETSTERMKQELPKLLDRFQSVNEPVITESPIDLPDPASELFKAVPKVLPDPQLKHVSSEVPTDTQELSENPSEWQPRQEVLAIKETRVTEVLEVLPRTLRDTKFDRPSAPDITFPGTPPDLIDFGRSPVTFQALVQEDLLTPSSSFGHGNLGPPSKGAASVGELNQPLDLIKMKIPELAAPEEFTPLQAVEKLLRLETRIWDDPENPALRYFKIQLLPNGIEQLPVLPRDVVYLIDCSASMTERKLRLAIEGINASLENLSEKDKVNIIAFRDEVDLLSSEGVTADTFGKAKIRTFLSSLHARGQTDVFASLDALQALPKNPARTMLAMLVTDGVSTQGLTDSSEIIEKFSQENKGKISMFGLGAGGRVNRLLLDFLSFQNRGSSLVAPRSEGLPEMIKQASFEVSRPVLMNLRYQFTGNVQPVVYPESLSHLYVDRPLILIGRLPKHQNRIAFQIIGESAKGPHDIIYSINLDEMPEGSISLRQEWAWQAYLEGLSTTIGNPNPTTQAELDQLIQSYNLVVPEAYR